MEEEVEKGEDEVKKGKKKEGRLKEEALITKRT
jgi:hypothetical protein